MRSFATKDKLGKIKGTVTMSFYKADGTLIKTYKQNNLVVNTGRGKLALVLAGVSAGNFVSQISCGTSNTATSVTDTVITGATNLAIGAVSYPSGTSVKWAWTIGTGDANGTTIQELGLKTGDGTLFSRIVTPAIVKTVAIYIVGTWEIDF